MRETEPAAQSDSSDADRVEELVFRCLEAADPLASLADAENEHPDLAPKLRRVFRQLQRQGMLDDVDQKTEEIPDRLGEFRLIRRLGAGGMGVVYLAEDDQLGRTVALKLIRPEQVFFPGARQRFQREVETIARLQHPGIVPVFAVGKHDGIPYFTMERVVGCSLADVIAELREGASEPSARALVNILSRHAGRETDSGTATRIADDLGGMAWPDACVRLIAQVASALHYAHERGILHRDVKPSNILITPDGRARLVDFGLAWSDHGDQRLTQSTSHVGSLPYLPPEYVSGNLREPTRRVDVYSLGVTLYELLTLRNPYLATTNEETRRRILEAHPTPPRKLEKSISWELETTCMVAMDPDPVQRYGTVGALLRDLDHIRDRKPIEAQRPGLVLRARRWTQRRPTLSATVAVAFIGTAIASIGFGVYEHDARQEAERLTAEAERERYSALLSTANLELGAGARPGEARQRLAECRETDRGWEWHHLEFLTDESVAVIDLEKPVVSIAWSPDGSLLATATEDRVLRLWRDGVEIASVEEVAAAGLAFHPRSGELITGTNFGKLQARDPRTGELIAEFEGSGQVGPAIPAIGFSDDGARIFSCGGDGRVVAWDAEARTKLRVFGQHPFLGNCLDVSRDGRWIASGGYGKTVHVYDATTLELIATFETRHWALGLQFSADGRWLYTADRDGMLAWDLDDAGAEGVVVDPVAKRALALALSPDGRHLAAAVNRRMMQLYRLDPERPADSRMVKRLVAHEGYLQLIAFRPDGTFATAGSESSVRLWNPAYAAIRATQVHRRIVKSMAVAADGRVISADSAGGLAVTDIETATTTVLPDHSIGVVALGRVDDGWYSVDADGGLRFWHGTEFVRGFDTDILATAACVRGRQLLVADRDGSVTVVDIDDGRTIETKPLHERWVHCIVADRSGSRVWTATTGGVLRQWNGELELERELPRHPGWISALELAPDESWLASACNDTAIRVFDTATGRERHRLRGHGLTPSALTTTPSGDRLVSSGGFENQLRVWEPTSGRLLLSITVPEAVTTLSFAADGRQLVCGARFGALRWLRTRPGGPRAIPPPEDTDELDTMTGAPDARHR